MLGQKPTPVPGVPGLWAMNIDPEAAARAYREQMVAPYRGVLPDAGWRQHGGAVLRVVHHRDRRLRRVLASARRRRRDGGVRPRDLRHRPDRAHAAAVDPARAPGTGSCRTAPTGASCLGPLAGLEAQREALPGTRSRRWATRRSTTARAGHAGRAGGPARGGPRRAANWRRWAIENQHLVVNGVFTAPIRTTPWPPPWRAAGSRRSDDVPASAGSPARDDGAARRERARRGSTRCAHLAGRDVATWRRRRRVDDAVEGSLPPLADLVEELAASGRGLVHGDGQGRRRQDDHRGRHRRRPGRPRLPRPSDHDRPRRHVAERSTAATAPTSEGQPHRPARPRPQPTRPR